jgi:hypothetical protein
VYTNRTRASSAETGFPDLAFYSRQAKKFLRTLFAAHRNKSGSNAIIRFVGVSAIECA